MAYVYRHIRPDKNEPFYIGVGEDNRAFVKKSRNKHWHNIVEFCSGDYRIEIIMDDLSHEEACEKEIEFIALYGRSDLKKGPLCNLTDGGEGSKGYTHSKETREKMRVNGKGKLLGTKQTSSHIEKVRATKIGKKLSPEWCINIGLAKARDKAPFWKKFGKDHPTSKSILCINTGVIYGGVSEAARMLGLNIGHIASVARGVLPYTGSKKYSGGLKFVYIS